MFSIYFLLSVICAYPSAANETPLGEGEEVFLVALRSGLLSELMQKPILQSEPIAETAGRTKMREIKSSDC